MCDSFRNVDVRRLDQKDQVVTRMECARVKMVTMVTSVENVLKLTWYWTMDHVAVSSHSSIDSRFYSFNAKGAICQLLVVSCG